MNAKGRIPERVTKQPFCCLVHWSARTPAWPKCKALWCSDSQPHSAHLVLRTKAHHVWPGSLGGDRDVSGKLDHPL